MEFAIVYVCAIPARGKKCLVVSCFYNSSMHQTMNILIYGVEGSRQINPIQTRDGRLSPPMYYPDVFHLPASLTLFVKVEKLFKMK